ncbi:MAG: phosphatidylserine/phosphatidylglycerophosphate/cardiolipin synthase family protein [Sphingopyxis sp.]
MMASGYQTQIEPADISANVAGNRLCVIQSGPERLATLLKLIDNAQNHIAMITYNFANDAAGQAVMTALARAAGRGVTVHLSIDDFGSSKTAQSFFAPLIDAGGVVQRFGVGWSRRYLVRNHQKLAVFDRAIALMGGFNIADAYFAPRSDPGGWRDLGLLIEGPAVEACQRWCDGLEQWMAQPHQSWRALSQLIRSFHSDGHALSLLIGGPTPRLSPWARQLRQDISLGSSMTAAMAYFSPNAGFLRRLSALAMRGGTSLILPAISDNGATVGASRLFYAYLLKRQVRLYEYDASLLHTKICVIDNITYIGSANLDMRSLYVNVELMLRIDDADFAEKCRDLIQDLAHQSTMVTDDIHKARATWLNRIRWALSWLMVGVIDYGVTRRLNFGLPKRN